MTIQEQFENHLNKVCKDKTIREFALQFFADLKEKYDGILFTAEDFETLTINGEVVQQDVVNSLFASKAEASAEEVFLYLFQNYVGNMKYSTLTTTIYGLGGYLSVPKKLLAIKNPPISKFYHKPKKSARTPLPTNLSPLQKIREALRRRREDKELFKLQKKLELARAKKSRLKHLKNIVYHELSHVFEIKTFENGKYIKTNMSDRVYSKTRHGMGEIVSSNVSSSNFIPSKAYVIHNNMSLSKRLEIVKYIWLEVGERAISEILNETHSLEVGKNLKISRHYANNITTAGSKCYLDGTCGYNRNYNISSLLTMAIGDGQEKNLRFNPTAIINKINNLKLSPGVLQNAKYEIIKAIELEQDILLLFTNPNGEGEEQEVINFIQTELSGASVYDTIRFSMGFASYLNQKDTEDNNILTKIKGSIQRILVDAITNDLQLQINNPNIKKDRAFFEKLNKTLEKIDNFIIYPMGQTTFNTSFGRRTEKDILIMPVDKQAKKYPQSAWLGMFSKLIQLSCELTDQYATNITDLPRIMTFLQEQQNLSERFDEIKAEYERSRMEAEYIQRPQSRFEKDESREDLF